jgi:hypothetical protein
LCLKHADAFIEIENEKESDDDQEKEVPVFPVAYTLADINKNGFTACDTDRNVWYYSRPADEWLKQDIKCAGECDACHKDDEECDACGEIYQNARAQNHISECRNCAANICRTCRFNPKRGDDGDMTYTCDGC